MQNILDYLQKYVPYYEREGTVKYAEQGVVGDQLTVERGVNGLFEVSNGFTAEERHEGLHFEVADFHGGMKFLEVNCNTGIYANNAATEKKLLQNPSLVPPFSFFKFTSKGLYIFRFILHS